MRSEMAMFVNRRRPLSTVIIQYPTKQFGIAGSVPSPLYGKVFTTEQKAINALVSIGCTRFQLADCSWYQVKQGE